MRLHLCMAAFLIILGTGMVSGQVATGAPPFSSLGGGPSDTVNLGNLNVHFMIPVLHKAGRGLPFNYDLAYDSSIWQPVVSNGTTFWQPVMQAGGVASYWGWQGLGPVYSPYVSYMVTYNSGNCQGGTWQEYTYTSFVYHDNAGTGHSFGASGYNITAGGCPPGQPPTGPSAPYTGQAQDGSGYTIHVNFGPVGGSITSTDGTILSVPFLTSPPTSSSPYAQTDANGNKISWDSINGVYTDTLGTQVLRMVGAAPNQTTLTYTAPSGTSASYTVSYKSYTVKTNFTCSNITNYGPLNKSLVDKITLPGGSQYSFTYEQTPGFPGNVTGRLISVTLPTGGTISYSYTGANNGIICTDGSAAGLSRQLNPGGTWTYARTQVSGSHWRTTVSDPTTPTANQTVVDFQKDSATTNFYETQRSVYQGSTSGTLLATTINCYNGNSVSTPSSCATTPVTSPIRRTTIFRYLPNSSGLQAETDTVIDQFGLTDEVEEYDYGQGAVGPLIRKTITAYTALGNGIVDRPSSVTIKDAGNNIQATTSYSYDETTPTTTSGTPQHVSVIGSRGLLTSVVAQVNGTTNLYRKYTYYDTGNLSTSTDVSTSGTSNGAQTTYNYSSTNNASCGNSFVTSITEPLGLSRSMTWDCIGGVLLSLTDENNNISSTAYSGTNYTNNFWRPYSTTDQAGFTTNYFYYLNSSNQPFQTESKSATFNSGNSIVDVLTTTDGFGRTTFSQTRQGPTSSNYDTVATCYDSLGRASFTSLPYSSLAITPGTSACPSGIPGTSTAYDALSRTTSVTDSGGGSTSYAYFENDVLQTLSSPTQKKQLEYDAFGRLKSVCEITTGTTAFPGGTCAQNTNPQPTGYYTTYSYDVLGNQTGVTQNAQASPSGRQTRAFVYDQLGRLTSETNPEMNNTAVTYSYDSLSSDASCGTYTSAGNLLKRLDAAGNATCYSGYDALHRVGTVTYPSSSTPAKHFVYDTATVNGANMLNAKTRLAEAYTCIGTCSSKITDLGFSYWPTGQTTDVWELTPHSGTNYYYHVASLPWPNGVVNTISNLSGLPTITYSTDGEGRLGTTSDSTPRNLVTSLAYNAASRVTGLTYGSSDSDSFSFDPNTGRMSNYTFSVNGKPDSGTLTWNPNSTLQQLVINDQIPGTTDSQTCTYTHDDLGRVASSDCGCSTWSQTFTYDPFGNIAKTVPGSCTGMSSQVSYDYTNNTNRIITSPYSYTSTADPNAKTGNLTADNNHAYAWDTDGHVTGIDSGTSSGICLNYDALGRVVEQGKGSTCNTSPTSSTEIVYSPSGAKLALMNGSSLVKAFVPLPGGAQAVYNSSGLQYYRHPDWLGSSRLATTSARTPYYSGGYAPFGENYAQAGTQDLSFTGQNQDTESSSAGGAGGLYDFLYREHSPVQGRWLSPDPAGVAAANPTDPQSWNRYAYVRNTPTTLSDALGLCDRDRDRDRDPGDGGGVWPGNETLGLPSGLNKSPLGLGGLIGLGPGTQCGDFIGCGSLGPMANDVVGVDDAAVIAGVTYGIGVTIYVLQKYGPAAIETLRQIIHATGEGRPYDPRKDLPADWAEKLANCSPGTFCSEPSRSYPGGVSNEQEYICSIGVWTVHWIQVGNKIVHGPHVRPGAPKCSGGE